MKRSEREAIMRQGVVLPETPRERRQLAGLAADLEDSPALGQPVRMRLRNFRPSSESYLASLGGPLAYMTRLRDIDRGSARHERVLTDAWRELAFEHAGDDAAFAKRWRSHAAAFDFTEINDLIQRHNRWYPVESRLPMDPTRGDYALVNGKDYRRAPLDADWILERLPPLLDLALAAAQAV